MEYINVIKSKRQSREDKPVAQSRNDLQYRGHKKNHQVKLLFTKHCANSTILSNMNPTTMRVN